MRVALTGAVVAPIALESSPAAAQEWLKDRMYQEGAGVRTGDLEWHPGIAIEGGYDSNYFLRTDKTFAGANLTNGAPAFPVQGSPVMRVTPSLTLETISPIRREGDVNYQPPTLNFRLGASGTYREFFGQLTPEQRNFSADVTARLDILPQHPVGGALFASYDRIIQPNPTETVANPDIAFNRDAVTAGGELAFQPGGGTLDFHVGNSFTDTLFEEAAAQTYSGFVNTAYLRGRWKFRPRTALLYEGNFGYSHFGNLNAGSGAITQLSDSAPVHTRIGVTGLVTPRFSLTALMGYGGSFVLPASANGYPAQYDSVIGNAELKFYLTAQPGLDGGPPSLTLSSLAVGYNRDFNISYLGNFYGSDRGYLKFSYFFAGRALISLEGGAGAVEYPELFYPAAPGGAASPLTYFGNSNPTGQGFTDVRIDATLYGEYRFTNYLGVNLTTKYTTELSDVVLNYAPGGIAGGTPLQYAMEWQHFEVYAGVRLFL